MRATCFALAGGGTNFSVANSGSGHSDLFQAGAFVKHTIGPAYISAALAYGWQDITTNRTVTAAGTNQLRAQFDANAFSGRLEGGYRFVAPWPNFLNSKKNVSVIKVGYPKVSTTRAEIWMREGSGAGKCAANHSIRESDREKDTWSTLQPFPVCAPLIRLAFSPSDQRKSSIWRTS
jgi:hypothetical protein